MRRDRHRPLVFLFVGGSFVVLAAVVVGFGIAGAEAEGLWSIATTMALLGAGFIWSALSQPTALVWPAGGPITVVSFLGGETRIKPSDVAALYDTSPVPFVRSQILEHRGGRIYLPQEFGDLSAFARRLSEENPYARVRVRIT